MFVIVYREKDEINKKRLGLAHILTNSSKAKYL